MRPGSAALAQAVLTGQVVPVPWKQPWFLLDAAQQGSGKTDNGRNLR